MAEVKLSRMECFVRSYIQHYNEKKYWKYRQDIINNTRGDFRSITDKLKLL